MKHSKWLILLCVVATLGLTGCSDDDDDVIAPPTGAAAAEAAIESALESVVDPLVTLVEFAMDYLGAVDGATDGIGCPDMTGACNPGSATCSEGAGLDFGFTGCTVVDSAPPLSLDGGIAYSPTLPPYGLFTLNEISVNGSTDLAGTVTLMDECNWSWQISADDGTSTTATLVLCQSARGESEYPTGESTLFIFAETSGGQLRVSFSFDGTQTAGATAFLDNSVIATCSVDLETFDATCTDADI